MSRGDTVDGFPSGQHPAALHTQIVQNFGNTFAQDLIIIHDQNRQPGQFCIICLWLSA